MKEKIDRAAWFLFILLTAISFGIPAAAQESPQPDVKLTMTLQSIKFKVGSADFCEPEQAKGALSIFALGLVFFGTEGKVVFETKAFREPGVDDPLELSVARNRAMVTLFGKVKPQLSAEGMKTAGCATGEGHSCLPELKVETEGCVIPDVVVSFIK